MKKIRRITYSTQSAKKTIILTGQVSFVLLPERLAESALHLRHPTQWVSPKLCQFTVLIPPGTPESVTPSAASAFSCKRHTEIFGCPYVSNIRPRTQALFNCAFFFCRTPQPQSLPCQCHRSFPPKRTCDIIDIPTFHCILTL